MDCFYQKFGLGHKWCTVVLSRPYDRVAEERNDHCNGRDNDAAARIVITPAWPFPPLQNVKKAKLCRFPNTPCWNRFQNFTGHSNLLESQPIVDMTGPSRLYVCSSTSLPVHKQLMETFLFGLESLDLCSLQLNCRNQRLFLDVHVLKLFLYFKHALINIVDGRGELIPFKEDIHNELKLGLAPIWRPPVLVPSGTYNLTRSKIWAALHQEAL